MLIGLILIALYVLLAGQRKTLSSVYQAGDVDRRQPFLINQGLPGALQAGGGENPQAAGEAAGRPVAILAENYYDFGSIGSQEVVEREFVVANQGQGNLVIRQAYTTCGCTSAELSSAVIGPGKVGLVALRFDAGYHNVTGTTVRRGLVLETNDPENPFLEIWVQASVRR